MLGIHARAEREQRPQGRRAGSVVAKSGRAEGCRSDSRSGRQVRAVPMVSIGMLAP
jgi:hypothetical protein